MVSEAVQHQPDDVPRREQGTAEPRAAAGERVDQLIRGFIKKRYGVALRDLYSSMRAGLLCDVEHVACNLCGADSPVALAHADKYGLDVTTVMCRQCGLMYLDPRPTAASYDRFYSEGSSEDGAYHVALSLANVEVQLKRHFGAGFAMTDGDTAALRAYTREKYASFANGSGEPNLDDAQVATALEAQAHARENWEFEAYADDLFAYLKPYVPSGCKMFEAGAGWGKLLVPWRDRHGCEVTGIEPRAATVQEARERLGIALFQGFPATADVPENTYDVVMNIRTINHMLDPLGDLRHAWRWLKPGGILFIDISDAIREAWYEGFEKNVVEIDHTYMFSVNTLSAMVEKAGFTVERKDVVDTRHVLHGDAGAQQLKQIRIVARKSEQEVEIHWPDPIAELAALLHGQLHRDRVLQDELEAVRRESLSVKQKRSKAQAKLKAHAGKPRAGKAQALNWRGLANFAQSLAHRNERKV